MYPLLRSLLFRLEPEKAHDLALAALARTVSLGGARLLGARRLVRPASFMGLEFPNPVGLAAGLDKNGDFIDALAALGFGFIEVGTVTPRPQPGNPRPRMFRLPQHQALINRLGFNNKGVDHLVERLRARKFTGPVGANLGKQKETPVAEAAADYRHCLERVYPHCDYVTVNVSSPNTADLRSLQDTGALAELLAELVGARAGLEQAHGLTRPLVLKIAPDWEPAALQASLEVIGAAGIDGLIATNTTLDREAVGDHPLASESGGLSGAPVLPLANRTLQTAREILGPDFPLIGTGGITRSGDAATKQSLGANLVQLYTGFIYQGPELVAGCVEAMGQAASR